MSKEVIDAIRAGAEPGQVYAVGISIELPYNAVKDVFDLLRTMKLRTLTRPMML
jgi:hypothetical protein